MDENKAVQETESQDRGDQASETGEEKLFTQEDVNRLIRERLKRAKSKPAEDTDNDLKEREDALLKREAELQKKLITIKCKEYLIQQGYPYDLLEILDVNDFESFKKKADKAMLLNKTGSKRPMPEFVPSERTSVDSGSFQPNTKHKPKQYY